MIGRKELTFKGYVLSGWRGRGVEEIRERYEGRGAGWAVNKRGPLSNT